MKQPPQRKIILVLSHMYPREYHLAGGIFVHEQVKALRARGIDARVISGEPFWAGMQNPLQIIRGIRCALKRPTQEWQVHDGVPLIRFPYIVSTRFLPFQWHAFTYTLGALRCVKKIRNSFDFNMIHAHTAFLDGSAAAKLASRYNIPFVITEHTGPFQMLTRTPMLRRRTAAAIKAADRLIAVSHALLNAIQDQIDSIPTDKIRVVPNVVNIQQFHHQTPALERNHGIQMLWVGHFVPIKRIPVLLEALSIAVKTEPKLRLKLVGAGDDEQEARKLTTHFGMEAYVTFAGAATRKVLVSHYHDCDFLVISSEQETFGVVAIEAISTGRPVLTTNCGGPEEIIIDKRLGIIVNKSADAIAKGMLEMVHRIKDFKSEIISHEAQKRFSHDQVGSQLERIYDELLCKPYARNN